MQSMSAAVRAMTVLVRCVPPAELFGCNRKPCFCPEVSGAKDKGDAGWRRPLEFHPTFAQASRSARLPKPLVQTEIHFNVDLHCHWVTVLHGRFELPVLHCFNGLLVQSHAEA